jgi:MATE family multidrug resistance protein
MPAPLSRRAIFAQAWPIMLGQASVPLVGIVDAAVIGRTGDTVALAGVALGATVINLIFWSFGFLRMGVTGLTAQAEGAGEANEVSALLVRSLAIGSGIGVLLFLLQAPITWAAFSLLAGDAGVSGEAGAYTAARFFGAPAALCVFALNGWLLGLGRTRAALTLQIVMNVANIGLDILFVWGFGMGAQGVGFGTAGAEWTALATGLVIVALLAGPRGRAAFARLPRALLVDPEAMKRLFAVNADLMIRTIALLFLFTWFANAGARLGATPLAANHILLQFVSVAAFILDAFAFTAESRIGNAIGARSPRQFDRAVRLTGEFSALGALLLALAFWLGGGAAIAFLTTDTGVRATASSLLGFAILIPVLGMPSWLLDGIFIGATRGRALRNAAIVSTALYVGLDLALRPYGNMGVWVAFAASYVLRAIALGWHYPALRRSLGGTEPLATPSQP